MTITLEGFLRLIAITVVSYIFIVFILRVSGKRTLSKMNSFDFIVTIALGSVLATTIVSYESSFWNGIIAFCMLVGMQYVSTWLSVRSQGIRNILKSEPTILYYDGVFDDKSLRNERLTKSEMKQAIRKSGYVSLDQISVVILETDGTLTVMKDAEKRTINKDDFIFRD